MIIVVFDDYWCFGGWTGGADCCWWWWCLPSLAWSYDPWLRTHWQSPVVFHSAERGTDTWSTWLNASCVGWVVVWTWQINEWFQVIWSLILMPYSTSSRLSNTFFSQELNHHHYYNTAMTSCLPSNILGTPTIFRQNLPPTGFFAGLQKSREICFLFLFVVFIKKTSPRSNLNISPTYSPTSPGKTCLVWWRWYFQWLPRWAL